VADIARLVRHAHRFHSRIFVTLNTILRDDELEPARKLAWQLYDAGADALIIQDMGLLEIDLPPIQLHASTQTDIRTPEKARFLQDVGFADRAGARTDAGADRRHPRGHRPGTLHARVLHPRRAVRGLQRPVLHQPRAHRAQRQPRRLLQACRLPYQVTDAQGRFVAHDKHVLSMKDNNQSANLRALIDAGVRSFKIEGRYKDMGYVKNITAHYRTLLDAILDARPELARGSSGRCAFGFTPDPDQNFNREFTDYFVNGRKDDIGAFDSCSKRPPSAGSACRGSPDCAKSAWN
jgi:putative protease